MRVSRAKGAIPCVVVTYRRDHSVFVGPVRPFWDRQVSRGTVAQHLISDFPSRRLRRPAGSTDSRRAAAVSPSWVRLCAPRASCVRPARRYRRRVLSAVGALRAAACRRASVRPRSASALVGSRVRHRAARAAVGTRRCCAPVSQRESPCGGCWRSIVSAQLSLPPQRRQRFPVPDLRRLTSPEYCCFHLARAAGC